MEIHIARDGKQFGPFPLEEVQRQLAAGTLLPTDFAWTTGAAGWVPLGSFPGLTVVSASVAPGGSPPSIPANVSAPSRPAQTSSGAIISLIFGILSFLFLPLIGGLVAIISGHMARSAIRHSGGAIKGDGMALAGTIIGYFNIGFFLCVVPILAGIAVPVFAEVQLKGKETKSLSNAKQIATACKLYAIDHQGAYPKTVDELVPDYLPNRETFASPLSPGEEIAYYYFGGKDTDPAEKILLMSKFQDKRGKRIIIRSDTSGRIELPPPGSVPAGGS